MIFPSLFFACEVWKFVDWKLDRLLCVRVMNTYLLTCSHNATERNTIRKTANKFDSTANQFWVIPKTDLSKTMDYSKWYKYLYLSVDFNLDDNSQSNSMLFWFCSVNENLKYTPFCYIHKLKKRKKNCFTSTQINIKKRFDVFVGQFWEQNKWDWMKEWKAVI